MNKILLDTDVVINLLKKREESLAKFSVLGESEFYISPIVIAEVYAGARKNETAQIEELFSYFKSVEINDSIAVLAGEYANRYRKAFQGISLEDYMIAATAKYFGLQLWTYNQKHYPMRDIVLV